MPETISDSRFHMWRTLFALAHADDIVSNEEIRYLAEALEDIAFSPEQRRILNEDIRQPRDPSLMFAGISDPADQALFFEYARKLVWVDGSYGAQEQSVMLDLIQKHIKNINLDDLVGKINLEFEQKD